MDSPYQFRNYHLTGLLPTVQISIVLVLFSGFLYGKGEFRVTPFLQHPSSDGMTIIWYSETNSPGNLTYGEHGSKLLKDQIAEPVLAKALSYSTWEDTTFFQDGAPSIPYRQRIRIENLKSGTNYDYTVTQGRERFSSSFRTAPAGNSPIRFIVYADCETEPESTGKFAKWTNPLNKASRKYVIDQTQGYANNLEVIKNRNPDLIFIAGDLVQHGGEQRDWDEFWRHNTDQSKSISLASKTPILAAMGNHEYFEGTKLDRYNQPGSERAAQKYLNYFEYPSNQAPRDEQDGRYYSQKYGPATIIVVDLCNNSPNASNDDTNFFLLGENDTYGGNSPDFGPHSRQYRWLEIQLMRAQLTSLFTFVVFHHAPYSSGIHGLPPGTNDRSDKQSGTATRLLTPIFLRYGVDAVFNGHDEMWERSEISGVEIKPDGSTAEHSIQFYDVGIGGDGLRGPIPGLKNSYQQFLAHIDAPEVWDGDVLIDGGKHYGHLEVDIKQKDDKSWEAQLKPIYIFPVYDHESKQYLGYERRQYDDQIVLTHPDFR